MGMRAAIAAATSGGGLVSSVSSWAGMEGAAASRAPAPRVDAPRVVLAALGVGFDALFAALRLGAVVASGRGCGWVGGCADGVGRQEERERERECAGSGPPLAFL
jgi:hypothetical protein